MERDGRRADRDGRDVRLSARVEQVLVENGAVTGVQLRNQADRGAPGEILEADQVVVNAPVWDLPRLFADDVLPWDLHDRIRMLAHNRNRACWLGFWIAAEEPVIAMSEREMSSFSTTPRCGLPGFTLNFTGYDPGISPPGEYLTCFGAAFDATENYGDRRWYDEMFEQLVARRARHASRRAQRAVEETACRQHLRRHLQAGPRRGGAPRRRGPWDRRAVADRGHDPGPRDRDRQGGALGDHHHRRRARAAAADFADTVRY